MENADEVRDAMLASIWEEILATSSDTVRNYPAADRAIAAGASNEDVVTAMRAASYDTAFRVLYLLDEQDSRRELVGLHEGLMEADPSGRGGEDLWN
jgi:hypothetical protein